MFPPYLVIAVLSRHILILYCRIGIASLLFEVAFLFESFLEVFSLPDFRALGVVAVVVLSWDCMFLKISGLVFVVVV